MTDTTVIALIGAGTTITASLIAAYFSNKAASRAADAVLAAADAVIKTEENTKITKTTSDKVDVVDIKTTEIHQLTNSHLSEITSQLKVALERISGLEQTALAIAKERLTSDKERADKREESNLANGSKSVNNPIPVTDQEVANLIRGDVTNKLDSIKDDVQK